jgi:hypothetical protein
LSQCIDRECFRVELTDERHKDAARAWPCRAAMAIAALIAHGTPNATATPMTAST